MSTVEYGLGQLRVLIAEDEPAIRLGLRLLIESLDAEVREAESGEQAFEILAAWMPHVVVTDVTLGAVSGMDVLGHVRAHLPGVKVVMISGYGTLELAVEAMRRGAAHFFSKPFDDAELLAEIKRHDPALPGGWGCRPSVSPGSPPRRSRRCNATVGRAACASWKIASSARSCSAAGKPSKPTTSTSTTTPPRGRAS